MLDGETEGFVKVHVAAGSDRIVGATIVARHAGEMLSELTLAIAQGIGLGTIARVIHPYPTQAEAIRKLGDAYNRTRLTPAGQAPVRAVAPLDAVAPGDAGRRARAAALLASAGAVGRRRRASGRRRRRGRAYGRLLEAHVRPATIDGIRLAAVDYAADQGGPAVSRRPSATWRGQGSTASAPARSASRSGRTPTISSPSRPCSTSTRSGASATAGPCLAPIWKKKVGTVGGREYALDDIEHGILRPEFRSPRVHSPSCARPCPART